MRSLILAITLAIAGITPAAAQLSFGFSSGGVSIGVNVPTYPQLVRVPGYPVYYAPNLPTNYFFYDGLYWVFQDGEWYQSSWYNGPWQLVPPDAVPLFILRVPVRYYHRPPAFFHGWALNAPPRWDEHWGRGWAEHHRNWNRWDHAHAPAAAPLPTYQRRYTGDRYPRAEQQFAERDRNYRYQPRDNVVRQHYEPRAAQGPQRQEQQRREREEQRAERHPNEQPQPGGSYRHGPTQRDAERWGSGG
jgi:hypothetical protein